MRRLPPRVDAPADDAALRLEHVSKVHPDGVRALDDVSLTVPARSFTAVMGRSGSGKSSLLHVAAGLDVPTSGRVLLAGIEIGGLSESRRTELRRDRIGFVFQAYNLIPALSVQENITLPMRLAGRGIDRAWVEHLVERVGLADRLHHRPAELSGGQQQRVAIARALVARPAVVFADEPTGALDGASASAVLDLLRSAVDDLGQTVVLVTHDPAVAARADRTVHVVAGRLVETAVAAAPAQLMEV